MLIYELKKIKIKQNAISLDQPCGMSAKWLRIWYKMWLKKWNTYIF